MRGSSESCRSGTGRKDFAVSDKPANDDRQPTPNTLSFSDLCAAFGINEGIALKRLAGILEHREQKEGEDG